MDRHFTERDVEALAAVLGVSPEREGNGVRFRVKRGEPARTLVLELYPGIRIGKRRGHLVSVYTPTAHLQLHFCTGYVVSDMLGEITFVAESNGKVSGLTVEREGGCALYANVDRQILSGDFTTLGPEVMMSGIALSLTESVLPPGKPNALSGPPERRQRRAGHRGVAARRTGRSRPRQA
jgi:hypothetical protein